MLDIKKIEHKRFPISKTDSHISSFNVAITCLDYEFILNDFYIRGFLYNNNFEHTRQIVKQTLSFSLVIIGK